MKKMVRLIGVALIALGLLLAAAAADGSGACGADLTWTMEGNILTIRGTGAMTDYSAGAAPWETGLRSVVVEQGATSVGANAFSGCADLERVVLSRSVTGIGANAFGGCGNLERIIIPAGTTTIDAAAFQGCDADRLTIIGAQGSYAQQYAADQGLRFEPIDTTLDNDHDKFNLTWTWYTGLGGFNDQGGCYSTSTLGQIRIPDDQRVGTAMDVPDWTLTHVSGPDCFTLHQPDNDDRHWTREFAPVEENLATGTAVYDVTCSYNGLTYTGRAVIKVVEANPIPSGMRLRAAKFAAAREGRYTDTDGVLEIRQDERYVLLAEYLGGAPDNDADNHWLNAWFDDGARAVERWDFNDDQGEHIFHSYNMVIDGRQPGVYHVGATLTIGYSNLECYLPVTLRVADKDGNVPEGGQEEYRGLENGDSFWTWYVDLVPGVPENGGTCSDSAIIQLRIPEEAWNEGGGRNAGEPVWSIENRHTSGTGADYDFTYEIEEGNEGRGISLLPADDMSALGENQYGITCEWNGQLFETLITIRYVREQAYPTDVSLTVAPFDGDTMSIGTAEPVTDHTFTLTEGRYYVITTTFANNAPSIDATPYMNWGDVNDEDVLREIGRYDDVLRVNGEYILRDNQCLFLAGRPGTYTFMSSLHVGMSNFETRNTFTLVIQDEQGNDLHFNPAFFGKYDTFYYMGVDDDLDTLEDGKMQVDPFVTQYWLSGWEPLRERFSTDPVFAWTVEGNAQFRIEPDASCEQPFITIYLDAMPAEPEVDVIHLSCEWEGLTWTQDHTVTFLQPSAGDLPAGVELLFDEPLTFVAGTGLAPTELMRFANGWRGAEEDFYECKPLYLYECSEYSEEREWEYAGWDEERQTTLYTLSEFGEYQACLQLTSGRLVWRQPLTLRVTDENGEIPERQLTLSTSQTEQWRGLFEADESAGLWRRSQAIDFWFDDEECWIEPLDSLPEWACSYTQTGDARVQFDFSADEEWPLASLSVDADAPTDVTFTVTAAWRDQTVSTDVVVHFVELEVLPTDVNTPMETVELAVDEPWGCALEFVPAEFSLGNEKTATFGNHGYGMLQGLGETFDANWEGNTLELVFHVPGTYEFMMGLQDGNLALTRDVTFRVGGGEAQGGEMILPADLDAIEAEAFAGVAASVIVIPEGCSSIGDRAFAGCPNLETLVIPNSVSAFGSEIVADCAHPVTIVTAEGSRAWIWANGEGLLTQSE